MRDLVAKVVDRARRAPILAETHAHHGWMVTVSYVQIRKLSPIMDRPARSDALLFVTLSLIAAAFVLFSVYVARGEGSDDAAISLAYGKNLVQGHWLVLSPGAKPVEGYSNFLWVIILAPVAATNLDGMLVAKILGIVLSVGTLLLLARIPGLAERRGMNGIDLIAPALTAVALPFALWAASGLENGMESLLLLLAVVLSMREINEREAFPWSALVFLALVLIRPEGAVFWLAAAAHRVLLGFFGRRPSLSDVRWVAVFVIPLAVYQAWHYQYFGELVPNTYFAKANGRSPVHVLAYLTDPSDPEFQYVLSFLWEYWLALEGLVLLVAFNRQCLASGHGLRQYTLPTMMLLAGFVAIVIDGGDWMADHRLVSPLLPLFYLSIQESVRAVSRDPGGVRPWSASAIVRVSLASVVAVVVFSSAAWATHKRVSSVHATPYGALYSAVETRADRLQALAQCLGLDRPSVLTPDVGAIAYDTDFPIIDLAGLGDAYIARHRVGPALNDYVFTRRRPDIIWTHTVWLSGLDRDPRLVSDYTPVLIERDRAGNLFEGVWVRRDILPVSSAAGASAVFPCPGF